MKCVVLMLLVLIQVDASYQQNILPEHKRRHCIALQTADIMEHALPEIRRILQAEAEKNRHLLQAEAENTRRLHEDIDSALGGVILLRCEPGWIYYDNHCYLFSQTPITWENAVEECQSKNAYLADIQSAEENRFVKMEVKRLKKEHSVRKSFYIGGYVKEGKWIWIMTGDSIEYTDWGPDQPDNTGQECLILYYDTGYLWHDFECDRNFFMICKKRVEHKVYP